MGALDQPAQPLALRHGYRSASWRCRRGRASAARCADRRRDRADGWRRHGAARAATAAPGRARRRAPAPSAAGRSAAASGGRRGRATETASGDGRAVGQELFAALEIVRQSAARAGSLSGTTRSLPPLPRDQQKARIAPRRGERQGHQLRHPQTGRIKQLEDATEPRALLSGPVLRCGDQATDLGLRSIFWAAAGRAAACRAPPSGRPAAALRAAEIGRTAASPRSAGPACAASA